MSGHIYLCTFLNAQSSLLPSFHHSPRLIFFSLSFNIPSLSFHPSPSPPISIHTSCVAHCLCQRLTKGPGLENGSRAQSPCSVPARVPETVSLHIPFENTMQPTAEALQIGRDKAEMRGREREGEKDEVKERNAQWHCCKQLPLMASSFPHRDCVEGTMSSTLMVR